MDLVSLRPASSCRGLVSWKAVMPLSGQLGIVGGRQRIFGLSRNAAFRFLGAKARRRNASVCMVLRNGGLDDLALTAEGDESAEEEVMAASSSSFQLAASVASSVDPQAKTVDKARRRKVQRSVYLWAAIFSSLGFTTLAAAAVYYRFVWQMQGGGEIPTVEVLGTFSLAVGAAVGMEFWARWAHKALWHASLWSMHESHHRPRDGPFELNDVFAIINAVPAIGLLAFGFFNRGLVPGLCFGAGLGITMFGIAYMFIHDGLVHRRFPVGPIADVPYLQKVAAAHQLHHADLFKGVPYGLFLGPQELESVGGLGELEDLLKSKRKGSKQARPETS